MGEAAAAIVPHEYKPRNPQQSQYYRCVEDHFESFELGYDERFSARYGFLRPYVKDVMLRYLDCGDLHGGFARIKCPDCGHERLLAFVLERSGNPAASGTSAATSARHAIRSGWLNSVSGCAWKSSKKSLTAMLSSAYQRFCAGISCMTEACSQI
jgi:hypothetical protein